MVSLKRHVPRQDWAKSTFDDNFNEMWKQENLLGVMEGTEGQITNSRVAFNSNVGSRRTSHLYRDGNWAFVSLDIDIGFSRTLDVGGNIELHLATITDSNFFPMDITPLIPWGGPWVRGYVRDDGQIWITRAGTTQINAGTRITMSGWYYRKNRSASADSPKYPVQPAYFDLDQYNSNLDEFDTRVTKINSGHTTFDRSPVGASGLFSYSNLLEEVSDSPSTVLRYGNVAHVNLVGRLTRDISSNSNGIIDDGYAWMSTTRLVPRHTVGIASGGVDGSNNTPPLTLRFSYNRKMDIINTFRANITIPKGNVVKFAGTLLLA